MILSTNEFDFWCPQEGFVPADELQMRESDEKWREDVERSYSLKLSNGNFGRIKIRMIAGGDHFARLEWFLNPSGSQHMEFDPDIQLKQTDFR